MPYSKDYFELQLKFCQKVSALTGQKLEDTLLEYSSFYKTFRIEGWEFDRDNPIWQEFLNKIAATNDILEEIYSFYLEQIKLRGEKSEKQMFGCFSYEYEKDESYIQLHFRNTDPPEPGALSKEKITERRKELKKMFQEIKRLYPQAKTVCGFSWLYNLQAYNRLFPTEYIKTVRPVAYWFKSTALWGQFLDSAGKVKYDLAQSFLNKMEAQISLKDLIACFPLPLLEVEAEINYFYKFYAIA